MRLTRTLVKVCSKARLEKPVLVLGLAGHGDVGRATVKLLLRLTKAEGLADLYSPFFPDHVTIDGAGISHLPRYEVYGCPSTRPNLLLVTGQYHPDPDSTPACYEVSGALLALARKLGCRRLVTVEGRLVKAEETGVQVAATSSRVAALVAKRGGGELYREKTIAGVPGVLLGLARLRGLSGVCLLTATSGKAPDEGAAALTLRFLDRALKLGLTA